MHVGASLHTPAANGAGSARWYPQIGLAAHSLDKHCVPMELEPPPPPNFRSPAWGWTKATRALTLLVLVFALYLIVGETPATHGAVYDDDGFDAIDDFRGAVLDGGSGKAALTVYECTLDAHGCAPGSVKSKQLSRAKADAVAAIRAADLSQLVTAPTPPLSIGLTGGVRAAMARGDLARPDVDAFFASITRPTRTLQVLSGADEARLERSRGGGYCAHAALGVHSDRVGTMGSGGATMQLAAPGDDGAVASLSTDLLGIEDRAAATGDEAALREWRDNIDAQLASVDVRGFADAEVVFGLAMHASAAALAGVDGRRVMRNGGETPFRRSSAPRPRPVRPGTPSARRIPITWTRSSATGDAVQRRTDASGCRPADRGRLDASTSRDRSATSRRDWSLGMFLELRGCRRGGPASP